MSQSWGIERVYDEHAQAVFAFLLNFTRDEHDTRDLLQELFVRLARRPDLLRSARDERGYLLRMAGNMAIDLMRRRGVRDKCHEAWEQGSAEVFAEAANPDEAQFREAVSAALGDLPAEQRAIVHLKLWEDRTFEEIAEAMNISPNTAASRYRYGIDKLRGRLRPLYEEIKNPGSA